MRTSYVSADRLVVLAARNLVVCCMLHVAVCRLCCSIRFRRVVAMCHRRLSDKRTLREPSDSAIC